MSRKENPVMRMLQFVQVPHERFNEAVRSGKAGEILERILADVKPEAVFFTERDGNRGAVLVVNVNQPSDIPALAEPWFLSFNADCEFRIAMTPEDLKQAGLGPLGQKWA
jgi:hypothetical protein